MLKIGLTGGIGSGKSTVAKQFAKLGISIIDTDEISHQLAAPQGECYQQIVEHFGSLITLPDGRIDRKQLSKLAFADPPARQWLEQTLHPKILQTVSKRVAQAKSPYCVVVVPLLIEAHLVAQFDRILVVDLAEAVQIERAAQRDKLTTTEVEKIMQIQCTRQQRLAYADDIINNNSSLEQLQKQIERLHEQYLLNLRQ